MITTTLLIISVILNTVAAVMNGRAYRRWHRRRKELNESHCQLLGFAAFISTPQSGAPPIIRDIARRMLPDGAKVTIETGESPTLH